MSKFIKIFTIAAFAIFVLISCNKQEKQPEVTLTENDFVTYAVGIETKLRELTVPWFNAYFEASIQSVDSNWNNVAKLEMAYNSYISNPEIFNKLKEFKEANVVKDPVQIRRLNVLYNEALSKQADTNLLNEISKMTSEIEKKYSNYRAEVGGKKFSDNDVEEILKSSTNQKELMDVWTAHKGIGPVVKDDIIALVKKRNELAKKLGFSNYHEMSLELSFQNPNDIETLFDELDALTRDEFLRLKTDIDNYLAKRNKIKPEQLMPWHFQNRYFQEAPQIYEVDNDKYFEKLDVVKLTNDFYKTLNLPIDAIVAKSDLYEKKGKNQHAYCINVDRTEKDIRVLCNVKPTARWMETMLHEYGHALYENYYDATIPWSLQTPAHTFTTESIAMLFGRFAFKPVWMKDMGIINEAEMKKIDETCFKILKMQQLVFSRWSQVMYRFEKSMYADPDQDLNKLWWDLVEKYQLVKKPEGRNMPDWATKIHIATSPCYYHNYHLGELLASQLYNTITTKVLNAPGTEQSFFNQPKVGEYLIENVFKVGAKYEWNEMIEKATGEKLTPKYYAEQFVNRK